MKFNQGVILGIVAGITVLATGFAASFILDDMLPGIILSFIFLVVGTVMFFAFIKPNMEYSRIMKTGSPAIATILAVHETGTRINNKPLMKFEVQVELSGFPAYTTTAKSVVSYFQISQFQPGTKVPVMVDAANDKKIIFIRKQDLPQTHTFSNASPHQVQEIKDELIEMQEENDRIKTVGIYCKAIVTKFTSMGVNVNGNNPLATIEVQVLPDYEPAFSSTIKGAIKESSVPLYQPGKEIYVKYDPNDKNKAAIVH